VDLQSALLNRVNGLNLLVRSGESVLRKISYKINLSHAISHLSHAMSHLSHAISHLLHATMR
jgi:hypothetical protein